MKQSVRRHFCVILSVTALIAMGAGSLATKANAQQPSMSPTPLPLASPNQQSSAPNQSSPTSSFVQSTNLLDTKISKEIARGAKILKKWHGRIGLYRDEGVNHVTITSCVDDFIAQGFDYLSDDRNILTLYKRDVCRGHLSRIFDEGNALLDTRNRIADGALNGASDERKLDVLLRMRRYANQLEADDEGLTFYQSRIAEQKKKIQANSEYAVRPSEPGADQPSDERFWDFLQAGKALIDTGSSLADLSKSLQHLNDPERTSDERFWDFLQAGKALIDTGSSLADLRRHLKHINEP